MNESESISEIAPTGSNGLVEGTQADYRRIVDGVPGCILVAGSEGQIVYANKVAIATLGRTLKDLSGAGWMKNLDSNFITEAETTWRRCVQEREPLDAIWRFRQHDGTYRWHHLRAEPTIDQVRYLAALCNWRGCASRLIWQKPETDVQGSSSCDCPFDSP